MQVWVRGFHTWALRLGAGGKICLCEHLPFLDTKNRMRGSTLWRRLYWAMFFWKFALAQPVSSLIAFCGLIWEAMTHSSVSCLLLTYRDFYKERKQWWSVTWSQSVIALHACESSWITPTTTSSSFQGTTHFDPTITVMCVCLLWKSLCVSFHFYLKYSHPTYQGLRGRSSLQEDFVRASWYFHPWRIKNIF